MRQRHSFDTENGTGRDPFPHFFLYGEPPRDVRGRFLHVESLHVRSRGVDWHINPHAHDELHHVFFIETGGGDALIEDVKTTFLAPAILLVPMRHVHGFKWMAESKGSVLTISNEYCSELLGREPAFAPLFERAGVLPLDVDFPNRCWLEENIERLDRELSRSAPAHSTAVEAHFQTVLIEVLRGTCVHQMPAAAGPYAAIVARFREAIEAGFRTRQSIGDYACALNVSVATLRAACLSVVRKPPSGLLQERILLEAKRLLMHSNMPIAQVGYHLGFEDPAYFSRIFCRQAGCSPREFRELHFTK